MTTALKLGMAAVFVATLTASGGYWYGKQQAIVHKDGSAETNTLAKSASEARKILFYRNPMGLPDTSPTPKKDPMGMDYIPVYEGEQEGASQVAQNLIGEAIKHLFVEFFPKIEKLQKQSTESPYDDLISWFFNQKEGFELLDDAREKEYKSLLDAISPLDDLIGKYQPNLVTEDSYFVKEFVLWALVEYDKLSKDRISHGYQFSDIYGNYINKL